MTDQELIQALIDYAKQDDWPIVDSDVLQLAAERMATLARVEAERDAAIADIKIAASGRCCQICGQDCAGYEEISACTAFEWRGAQGEG